MPIDYLQKILTAKVYDVAIETPLDAAPMLSRRLGNRVLLKREDQQPVFSFKLRGAYNKMAHLSPAARARGVIAASAGNHAQGVALAAQKLGCKATIVMPVTTPHIKIAAVEARGAKVVLHGDSYSDAYAHALALQKKSHATFVHPYDDPDVIAGQGTIGMEILRQWQGPIDAIFVAIGGGGLDQRHRVVREARPPRDQGHRRAAGRFRRDGALACGGPPGPARARRPVRRRRRGQGGGQGDLPHLPRARRRHRAGRHRRRVRRDQGRVRGYPLDPRAGRRAVGRRHQGVVRAASGEGPHVRRRSPAAPT